MKKTVTYYEDGSHGWYAVPTEELHKLGLLGKISEFSYVSENGKTVFLEEDDDAGLYFDCFKPGALDVRHIYKENIFIRKLPSFPGGVIIQER